MLVIAFFVISAVALGVVYMTYRKASGMQPFPPVMLVRFALGGLVLGVLFRCFVIISAGTVGVVDFWGQVSPASLTPGVNVRNPLAEIHVFSTRTQELKEVMDTPSREGLITHLEVSVWNRVLAEKAPEIYKTIGMGYEETILKPLIRSVAAHGYRRVRRQGPLHRRPGSHCGRDGKAGRTRCTGKGLLVEKVLLRSVKLPQMVSEAIERKLQAEQQAEQMKFILDRERQEAERKKIEAQGIAEFQKIVTQGITPSLLEWKGIEATEKISTSNNTKIVIIGNPKNGLPLILEGQRVHE